MKITKVLKLIKRSEDEDIECKPSLSQINEIVETVSAFSNTEGGKIIVGVNNSGRIIGVDIGKDTMERLANKISQNTDPRVHPRILMKEVEEKKIIIIDTKPSLDKLVLAFGRPYKRVGKSTRKMSKDEYEKLILEKHKEKLQFDKQICKDSALRDIDEEVVKWFLKKAKIERNLDISPKTKVTEVLEKLNLIVKGKLTNAALLLFGKNPQQLFSQAETKCARFKGTEPLEFIDMKVFGKGIIKQRDDAMEFVKEHIKLHAKIVEAERVEKWEYPIEAIREAITNAVCHRDYNSSGNAQIRVFDDRIEVWGCGPLPEPLTPEDLKKKHKSILRNPLIGKCFFLIKYIEEWGTGTNRMIEWCSKYGLPEPLFEEVTGDFVVTFRKYHITEEVLEGLNERQRKIIDYLKEHKQITRKVCMELLNLSKDTVIREFSALQKKDLVKRGGKGKNVYYSFK